MEALKMKRKALRTTFTITAKTIDEEITKSKIDFIKLRELSTQLTDKFQRLNTTQESISELLLNENKEDMYSTDFCEAEIYKDRYLSLKSKIENFENDTDLQSVKSSCERKYRLPKFELKKFDGDIKSFLGFWSQFSRIHEDEDMPPEDKFQYLISAIVPGTRAASLIGSFPPTAENYPEAIELLKERFGRKDLLVQVYVRELLKMVMKNAVSGRKCVDLTTLYDQLESHLRALDTLGRSKDKFADFLSPLVESCLPEDVLRAWERHRTSSILNKDAELPENSQRSLENLMAFLRQEVNGEEMINLARSGFGCQSKVKKEVVNSDKPEIPSASALISSTQGKTQCVFCKNFHLSQDCGKTGTMTIEEKKSSVIRKGLCLVCLKQGHMAKKCHSNVRCVICSKRHYAILCPDLPNSRSNVPPKKDKREETITTLFTIPSSTKPIYLKTLVLRLKNGGRSQYVRALLDDGSHLSYIEKDLARELRLSPTGKEVLSQGLFGGGRTPEADHYRYLINLGRIDKEFSCQVSVLDQPKICTMLPRVRDKHLLTELENHGIVLTDIGEEDPPIRLLLGADVLGRILTGRIEVLKSGISAIETSLGWSILGSEKKTTTVNMVTFCLQNFEIPKIWELENLGIVEPTEHKAVKLLEEETLVHFQETVKRKNHRYEVALPWLTGHPPVYNMYDVAESRLRSVTKRLLKENIFEAYDDVLRQWQRDGIIESIPENEILKPGHYLPHRPVIKPSSTTTKVRPVFDASFKRPGYASLNECLSVGPSLSEQIYPLLLRFRIGAIGVIAGIKQAFLQLSVRPEDRDYLRFLWWSIEDKSTLEFFRHCRVVFGVTSSPFLLNASIRHHLSSPEYQIECLQTTVEKLKQGFYVDNLTISVESQEELEQFKKQAMEMMNAASFELRCWAHTGIENQESQSVLGIKWDTGTGELYCVKPQIDTGCNEIVSKRKLLSIVNSIYDPIGFTSPATLLPKLLLQKAWCNKLDWDDELPSDMLLSYRRWARHLDLIDKCRIPRRILSGSVENATMHIFTDASAYGYACCAFLRCELDQEVRVSLVSAKARVAPVKRPTIPRLELLGAAIGARIASIILEALNLPLKTYFWTDSMIVLAWINNSEPWNTFVGNRIKEIRKLTNVEDWRFVPGDINPADLPSRSCNWSELLQSRWWEGPKWLYEGPDAWPYKEIILPEEAMVERRKTVVVNLNVEPKENFGERFLYFSSYPRIIRMTAWILRFCQNTRVNSCKLTRELSYEEIERAEEALIRIIQSEWSSDKREKYAQTIQFYEENNVLKVRSRLILGQDPKDFVRPIVLPDHPIVRRLIEYTHKELHHAGVQITLSHLRERFWIPCGRRIVKEVLQRCVICKKHTSKPVVPIVPAPLPADRISRVAAFEVTGTDLAGPIFLKRGEKAWIVIFTCAVYRAIHLELVTSLSTEAFMQALRRFFARRGRSSVMYSDNGTNFLGTSRALSTLKWEEIIAECAIQKIKWHFNPPAAPWYGGWWERMIGIVKQLLRKVLGRACVTYEEMVTLLCECESIVNARPLTYLYDDPNELRAIKPSDFIQDIKGNESIDLDVVDAKHLRKRVRYLQILRCQLRQRFQKEYLAELIRNKRLPSKRHILSPGDVVLIGSDNAKRLNWPLGRVIELFKGKDNIERVAKLRIANGEIIRPIQRIYPLEMSPTEISEVLPENTEGDAYINADNRGSTNSNKTSLQADEHREGQSQTIKKTRFGRRVVPVKRLDL